MAVQVWIGEKPEHPNERRAIVALANGLERLDGLYLILANFSVGGRNVDLVLIKQGVRVNLSIPQHKELSVGTLRALIRAAGLSVEEFLALL